MARVLVAEDNFAARDLFRSCLKFAGHDVVAVEDGRTAWKLLHRGWRFDHIFADYNMPAMDGLKLLRKVRADTRMSDVPFVLMSADVVVSDEDPTMLETLCKGLGADFVTKPVDYDELIARFLGT